VHLSKNISSKSLVPQALKPLPRLCVVNIPALLLLNPLLCNLDQRLLYTIAHLSASTYEQLGPCVEQFDNVRSVMIQTILNVFAAFGSIWLARKGQLEADCT
jgi:hypothetical protein